MIRVLLAEDQGMMRGALALLLGLEEDIEVVAQVGDGAQVLPEARRTEPDIAVLDIEMPGRSGLDVAADLRRERPEDGGAQPHRSGGDRAPQRLAVNHRLRARGAARPYDRWRMPSPLQGDPLTDSTGALPGLVPSPAAPRAARAAGYEIEEELRAAPSGTGRPVVIAGVDEVGRGAWAGPVVVCAAVTDLSPPPVLPGRGKRTVALTDSKLLTRAHREAFAEALPGWLAGHAMGASSPEEIDELGMTVALRRAAVRALEALPVQPDVVILDGKHDFLSRPWRVRCEIKADQRSVTVAAASVLAKVHRDRLMADLDNEFPGYGFADSAGYPSPAHQNALQEHGPTPHHRLSWSYLDDLPRWRHLKKHRDPLAGEGQLSLL